jgi:DNA-binding FadR family transcriptional regulator
MKVREIIRRIEAAGWATVKSRTGTANSSIPNGRAG